MEGFVRPHGGRTKVEQHTAVRTLLLTRNAQPRGREQLPAPSSLVNPSEGTIDRSRTHAVAEKDDDEYFSSLFPVTPCPTDRWGGGRWRPNGRSGELV